MSRDLVRRGFKFVGSTICYALMQATGMVNDHLVNCPRHAELGGVAVPRRAKRRRGCLLWFRPPRDSPIADFDRASWHEEFG